ncbi:D-aminoacyl-tRNA deacylase [bioreactor metagenome]|jgi:D-tyrosyl-tRNA(Tyr) deacylase|uniref:D-aminoacyl-tRNA deacylase n=1 Tax=bioreactor metagenome TaxID=1076179 RepID=A0A644UL91_9ZZZZ|nr:D-tyrosyl-tRNA(Tyr) deacylase [Bacteroidales bacterium]MBP6454972.1 D-tyrosyl-tRNA(Tyr) deacylase [Bacteroidales bacterium]MBP8678547.1 D-tyrosyl-tRNA(Tyr) deacylase [Bacteroidales bacterium]MBP9977737.1 D-tyrosyl-tRNA(Tyr) deacylase [Bacteroidales bacterium]WRQ33628.1 D-aminoacyl-tRNA deacylase [Bacteroidales bacterium MB20-C3-3]
MRVVIQRVEEASVDANNKLAGSIGKGLMILLGIEEEDTFEDADYLIKKIPSLRIFDDADGVMNLSLKDIQGEVLLVSQFTLHALTRKGNRPSYIRAARPEKAIPLYEYVVNNISVELGKEVKTGIFGAEMKVRLVNDGPVTIIIDTKENLNKNGSI